MKKNLTIAFVGPAGCGKTTIIREVFSQLDNGEIEVTKYIEEEKYSYLEDFYAEKDKSKLSLLLQMDFLTLRLRTLINAQEQNGVKLFDRFYMDDYGYMKFNYQKKWVTTDHLETYEEVLNQGINQLKQKDINVNCIFVLKLTKENLKKRIASRGRFNESELKYLVNDLHKLYFSNEKHIDMLRKKSENLYIINADNSVKDIAKEIILKIRHL